MATSEAQKKAIYSYRSNKVQMAITVSKEFAEALKNHAAENNISVTQLIVSTFEPIIKK